MRRMPAEDVKDQRQQILSGVVETLLRDLRDGNGDRDRRRQVEEWMRTLAEKYPEFKIEVGLRDYYLAEAERLRGEFDKASDLTEKPQGRTRTGTAFATRPSNVRVYQFRHLGNERV